MKKILVMTLLGISFFAYMVQAMDSQAEAVNWALMNVQKTSEEEKYDLYKAYVQRADADPVQVAEILQQVHGFQDERHRVEIFSFYFQNHLDPDSDLTEMAMEEVMKSGVLGKRSRK